jgi:hypothetical protein
MRMGLLRGDEIKRVLGIGYWRYWRSERGRNEKEC